MNGTWVLRELRCGREIDTGAEGGHGYGRDRSMEGTRA